jgi:AcrR family transcriptional regulator
VSGPASDTRDLILDAAEELFARQGLGPTTIKQIGEAARQNPALLYYYFGNKEGLYHAVLHRVVSALVARGGAALRASPSPPEAVRGLVKAQVEFVLTHPNAPKLLVREMIDHDAREAETLLLETAAGLFERLCTVIRRGQQSGVFRKDVEAHFAAVSTISQAMYFMVARPAISLFLHEPVTPATARAFAKHAGDFAVSALQDGSAARRPGGTSRRLGGSAARRSSKRKTS